MKGFERILQLIEETKQKIANQTYDGGKEQFIQVGKVTNPEPASRVTIEEIVSTTTALLNKVYGNNHSNTIEFLKRLKAAKEEFHVLY